MMEYPTHQRITGDSTLNPGQSSRRALGRVTSTQSGLFLTISSHIDTVTQVERSSLLAQARPSRSCLASSPTS